MSNSIDQKVVELKFNTRQFEQGVKSTQQNLAALDKSLQMQGATRGLDQVSSSIGGIDKKLLAFGTIGVTALANLTNAAISAGQKIAAAVMDPLIEGGKRRSLNIEQAKFQFKGLGLDVEETMNSAREAVKGTAYGLDEAAKIAGILGTSGMKAGQQMTTTLRAVAGTAAMAGAGFMEVGDIFTDVFGKGKAQTEDFNRLSARGVGAMQIMANHLGKTQAEIATMASKGQISAQMFADAMDKAFGAHATKANETYTGSLSNMRAALSRIGAQWFTPKMEQQRDLFNALTPLIDAIGDALAPVIKGFSDLNKIKNDNLIKFLKSSDVANALHNLTNMLLRLKGVAVNILTPIGRAFNTVFGDRTAKPLTDITGLLNRLAAAMEDATKDGSNLYRFFKGFFTVVAMVQKILESLAKILVAVFTKLFEVLKKVGTIFGTIFEPLASKFGNLNTKLGGFDSTVNNITNAVIGFVDWALNPLITALDWVNSAIDNVMSTRLGSFFASAKNDSEKFVGVGDRVSKMLESIRAFGEGLWAFVGPVVDKIVESISKIIGAFNGIDFTNLSTMINTGLLAIVGLSLKDLFDTINDGVSKLNDVIAWKDKFAEILDGVTGALSGMQNELNASALIKIAGAIGILAISMLILSSIDAPGLLNASLAMGVIVGALYSVMTVMTKLAATKGMGKIALASLALSMIAIAGSIAVLAVAIKIMSTMSWGEVARGLTVFAGALAAMVIAIKLLAKTKGAFKLQMLAPGLVALAFAMLILAGALKIMGSMSWDEIGRGLTVLAGALVLISGAMYLLGKVGLRAVPAAAALLLVSTSLAAIAGVIKLLGSMKPEEIEQGLVGVALALGLMAGTMIALGAAGAKGILAAAGLTAVALSILVIAKAVQMLGSMEPEQLKVGLLALLGILIAVVGTVAVLGALGSVAMSGAAVIAILAGSLMILAVVISMLAMLPVAGLVTAIIVIAVALGVLLGFAAAFGAAAPLLMAGAGVLALVSLAILLFAAAAMVFAMSLGVFAANAGPASEAMALLANAARELGPMTGWLALLGLSFLVFGAGAIVAAVGIGLLGIALVLLGAGLAVIGMFAGNAVSALIMLAMGFQMLMPFAEAFVKVGASLAVAGAGLLIVGIGAIVAGAGLLVLGKGLTLISRVGPKGAAALTLTVKQLAKLWSSAPKLLVVAGALAALGASILLLGVGVVLAGGGMMLLNIGLIMFMGIVNPAIAALEKLAAVAPTLEPAIAPLSSMGAAAMLLGVGLLLASVAGFSASAAFALITGSALSAAVSMVNLQSTATSSIPMITSAFAQLPIGIQSATTSAKTNLNAMSQAFTAASSTLGMSANTIAMTVTLMLAARITSGRAMVYSAAYNVGLAVSQGMANGIYSGSGAVNAAAASVAQSALNSAKRTLDVHSPSRETFWVGEMFDKGLEGGLLQGVSSVANAAGEVADAALNTLNTSMSGLSDLIMDGVDADPVIRPVLDLTGVQRDTGVLGNMLTGIQAPVLTLDQVSTIASDIQRPLDDDFEDFEDRRQVREVAGTTYIQNNYSPKALSTSDIYRQSHSLIATTKEGLNLPYDPASSGGKKN